MSKISDLPQDLQTILLFYGHGPGEDITPSTSNPVIGDSPHDGKISFRVGKDSTYLTFRKSFTEKDPARILEWFSSKLEVLPEGPDKQYFRRVAARLYLKNLMEGRSFEDLPEGPKKTILKTMHEAGIGMVGALEAGVMPKEDTSWYECATQIRTMIARLDELLLLEAH